ncbi:hypothetical protein BASA50_008595 [Batrachochytrium salamandrivorans]|uniref:ATP-dependent RNA helicase n=1 Tax=Batrachochytrium salamandrivorans TaxID=1357716 RepID=A0ABQ8F499_9FUNG|nr:hypothetical protein BASA60_010249 [Batrachochytrium salamandrivorans]KAH6577057.1 hypothetical protein BASA62_001055 [Batrachochytrium salamandrivorans]KAH6580234.1 hypothetical protein BASA61_009790 [Batrachochytrium salamandrivorans]KAH6591622.1 hypothetical protein BASA50_008595 [Batrachochytrium salamandrivorans]KAH9250419.1 hypothetical protein BASA81_011758 [Batrachochytrium salamandrivorans]
MFLTRNSANILLAVRRTGAVSATALTSSAGSATRRSLLTSAATSLHSHRCIAVGAARLPSPNIATLIARHNSALYRSFSTAETRLKEDQEDESDASCPPADSQYTNVPFSSLKLSSATLQALNQDFKYKNMSAVQERVLSQLPTERDLLVRAKTGTGKTLAFLIAAVETVVNRFKTRPDGVPILVLSPTRELALQIAREAGRLVAPRRWRISAAVGGESRMRNIRDITQSNCDILVATPGRLNDLLNNEPAVRRQLQGLKMLIYDEADVLLDMGFRKELDDINHNLPKERQTFLFSATISKEVRSIASSTLRRDYVSIDTVPANENDTHLKIQQSHVVAPHTQMMALLYDMISHHRKTTPNGKVLVFFNTTKTTNFITNVFNDMNDMDVLQIHSKLTQQQRSKVADRYRRSNSGILFTTDVSARGVDYPGVTLVIQVGSPPSRDQYIHRIGRTGRAGKTGEAIVLLSTYEKTFLDMIHDLPVQKSLVHTAFTGPRLDDVQSKVATAIKRQNIGDREDVYLAQLGNGIAQMSALGMRKETVVKATNSFSEGVLMLPEPPRVSPRMASNMGLAGILGGRVSGVSDGFSGSRNMYPQGGRSFSQRGDRDSFGGGDRRYGNGGDGGYGGYGGGSRGGNGGYGNNHKSNYSKSSHNDSDW